MLDHAAGELESSHHLALHHSKRLPPRTHGLGWGLKAHAFEFTGDFLTALRRRSTVSDEVRDSSVVRQKIQGCSSAMERAHRRHLK